MKSFTCGSCSAKVYFGNMRCVHCKHAVGFSAKQKAVITLVPTAHGGTSYKQMGSRNSQVLQYCGNSVHGTCNWLVAAGHPTGLCAACELNRTIPNLAEVGSLAAWGAIERAKKRLVYSLLRLGLPMKSDVPGHGELTFDFVRNAPTGHLNGVITIDVMEADSVERERQRTYFNEPYRTLLGHLRHETGHYFWPNLVVAQSATEAFRTLFGDERADYGAALARHHASGPPGDWQSRHVSAYASAHPAEDWAETWAHYLHMVDAVDTAEAEGMEPRAAGLAWGALWPFKPTDIYRDETFESLMERWIPLSLALNSLSRSIGINDFYPFVISAKARDKLAFVHRMVRGGRN